VKISLRFLVLVVVAVILLLPLTADSQVADVKEGFSSKDKPGGHWYVDDIRTLSPVTHQGKHVTMTINNVLYEQVLQGDFVDPTTVQGTLTRHKRSDNTTTTLQVTLIFTSTTTIKLQWVALDSNSDLHMGQSGLVSAIWLPDVKPLATQPPAALSPLIKVPPVDPPTPKPSDPMANID